MRHFVVRSLRILLILACCSVVPRLTAGAQTTAWDAQHFSLDAKALYSAASQSVAPESADVTVLTDEESYVFEADGRNVRTEYVIFKVLTQKGADSWASFAREWEPWHEVRPVIRARVITPDFVVHEVDQKTIADAPAGNEGSDMYSDRRVARAPLPAMAPGSVVEEEVMIKETAPFFAGGTVFRTYVGRFAVPVQHTRVVLNAPSSLSLRYQLSMLPDLKPQRTEADGRVRMVFDVTALAGQEEQEPNLPSDVIDFPMIEFATGTSWQKIAEEYSKIVDERIGASDIKALVEKLIRDKNARDEKVQAILEYLNHEIRYTGIEFSEASLIPHPPDLTLTHKYGDCKDKSTLLVAMLRAAGIPSYVALLNAGGRLNTPADLPGMGLFDHAIVYVPGERDYWIDATDEYARLGQMPIGDQGRMALLVRGESTGLVKTAEFSSQDNVLFEAREIHLAENGPADIVETSQPRGIFESEYRGLYADAKNKGNHDNLNDYMKSQYLAEKLDRMERSTPGDFSKQFELVLESKKSRRGFTDLDSAVAAIRLEGLFYRLPGELKERENKDEDKNAVKPKKIRTADFMLPEPFVAEWHYKVTPPAGFQAKPLPAEVKLALGPAQLTEEFSADQDGTVHAVLRFDTVKRRFTVAEATEMRNKVSDLRNGDAIMINFEPKGQALFRQGKVKESFQSYRSLIAQHPTEALHHLQIAKAFLDSGMGDAARDEARLAVKLEPNSALAQKTLGGILEYDLVGRKLRPGSDYPGAAAAYRAAVKLDPEDKDTVGTLAILLEYNDFGVRYGSGSHLKEAVEVYRSLPEEKLASIGLQNNPAYALFYAGEFAEARKSAEALSQQPKELIVACEAAIHGGEAGIAEANKRSSGEAQFKELVRTAGNMLMNVRVYPAAAEFMQAGASGDNAARTMGLASMLRKARKHEDIQFADDPTGVVAKYFLLSIDPNLTVEKLNAVLSKNARLVLSNTTPEEVENMLKVGKQVRAQLARTGASPDVTLDVIVESLDPKGEGNDANGYRENVQIFGKKLTILIVKEDGKYKMLDSLEKPNAVGLEMLDRVAAKNLEGARVLLDWIREQQHLAGGDDPFEGVVFPRFWSKGASADPVQMKLAAAALLTQSQPTAKQGVAILEEARRSVTDEALKTSIEVALISGYTYLQDYAKVIELTRDLRKKSPDSKYLFLSESFALRTLGKFDDVNTLVQERLKKFPDDIDGLRALVRNAVAREDYKGAHDLEQKIIDAGKAEPSDMNAMAWQTLFYDSPDGPDIAMAIKASQASPNSTAILHTLGSLYAAAGKTKEAREVLIQSMDLLYLTEPNPDYWYAFGRIAEQYGENEVARADYARVTKPKQAFMIPDSSYRLAQDRMKLLPIDSQQKVARDKS